MDISVPSWSGRDLFSSIDFFFGKVKKMDKILLSMYRPKKGVNSEIRVETTPPPFISLDITSSYHVTRKHADWKQIRI